MVKVSTWVLLVHPGQQFGVQCSVLGVKFCPNVKIYKIKGNILSQYSHFLKKERKKRIFQIS